MERRALRPRRGGSDWPARVMVLVFVAVTLWALFHSVIASIEWWKAVELFYDAYDVLEELGK